VLLVFDEPLAAPIFNIEPIILPATATAFDDEATTQEIIPHVLNGCTIVAVRLNKTLGKCFFVVSENPCLLAALFF
jgi:hypothetical protein